MSAQVEALLAAVNQNDLAAVSSLLAIAPALASAGRQNGPTIERCPALARAASLGQVEIVRQLLKHGADPNAMYRDDYGTALTAACECLAHGAGDVVKVLLDGGADPGLSDALEVVVTTYARNPGEKHKVVRHLMHAGESGGHHPAVLAVHAGDVKTLTALIARDPGLIGKQFAGVDYLSWPVHLGAPTLLHIAADMGETAIAQLLIAAGMDVNVRSGPAEGGCGFQTPAFHCVAAPSGAGLGVLRLLMEQRADLGMTATVMFPDEARGVSDLAGKTVKLSPLGLAIHLQSAPVWRNTGEAAKLLQGAGASM